MRQIRIKKRSMADRDYPNYFLIPAAAIFLMFFIVPVIMGFVYSFTNWNLRNPNIEFVGLYQFQQLFADELFISALANTFTFAVVVTILQNVLGLVLAMIIVQKLKTKEFLQTIFFLPCILSVLIVGYAFKAIYHPTGVLNNILDTIGLHALTSDWLNTPVVNLFSIIAVNVWMYMGFNMTIFLTGLKNIPADILEAAMIDGASPWKRFTSVIFPMLAPALTINVLMTFIGAMKVFDIVLALTKGGPGHMTEVLNGVVFRTFGQGRFGYGTAVSVVLFLVITVLAVFILKYLRRKEVDV